MTTINYIFEYLLCLSEVIVFYLFLDYLSDNKVKYGKPLIRFFIPIISFIVFVFTLFQFPIYIQGALTCLVYFVFSMVYDLSFSYQFFIVLLFHLTVILVELFFISLFGSISSLHPTKILALNGDLRYIIALISKCINFLCIYIIARIIKPNKILLPKRYSFFIWGIFLLTIFTMLFLFQQTLVLSANTKISNILFMTSITFIIINVTIFYYYLSSNQFYLENQKQEIERLYQKANERYISENKRQSEYLHKIWHDLNNHIKNLELLMNSSDHKDSLQYIEFLKKSANKIPNKILTGNKIADVVLNRKSTDATLNHIKFHVDAIIPSILSIEDADFSSILFNSIDNAIEASLNIQNKENRLIEIKIYLKKQYLCYQIINNVSPFQLNQSKKYFNRKKYISPGYGLKILQDIADKYEGYLEYGIHGDQFILRMCLLLDRVDEDDWC